MVTLKSVEAQLKRISFNHSAWNHAEAMELPNILMPGEEIFECVNGTYEGGFALLCATNVRLLLVDKKPLKFLTVEDLRFDMINQIDYSHRLFGARISVSAGSKNLKFMSYNQQRLRKLIGHIQNCMADAKKQQSNNAETQQQHLEKINQQLQAYLLAQQQQQEELRKQLQTAQHQSKEVEYHEPAPVKPTPELADYLFAQRLLEEYQSKSKIDENKIDTKVADTQTTQNQEDSTPLQLVDADLYTAARQEVFGKMQQQFQPVQDTSQSTFAQAANSNMPTISNPLEINPLRIAYSKLPMALRDRAFARRLTRSRSLEAAGT